MKGHGVAATIMTRAQAEVANVTRFRWRSFSAFLERPRPIVAMMTAGTMIAMCSKPKKRRVETFSDA
jgi:hypothetical protein